MSRSVKSEAQKQARRRLSYIDPQNCGKVLAKPAYWTVEFLELYLDRCDELAFHTPADGWALGQHAATLAGRIRADGGPSEFADDNAKRSARVIAASVQGSCARANAKLADAERWFRFSGSLAAEGKITPRAFCEFLRRSAALKACLYTEDAEESLIQAVKTAERFEEKPNLADALVCMGMYYGTQKRGGVELLARGLALADPKTPRGRRTLQGAVINMAKGSIRAGDFESAAAWLKTAKRGLARLETSLQKLRVSWLEAYFSGMLGSTRYATRNLEKIRHQFLTLESSADYLLCTFDLIEILLNEGADQEIREILAEIKTDEAQDIEGPLMAEIHSWYSEPAMADRQKMKIVLANKLQAQSL